MRGVSNTLSIPPSLYKWPQRVSSQQFSHPVVFPDQQSFSQFTLAPELLYILLKEPWPSTSPGKKDATRHFRYPGLPRSSLWGICEFLLSKESHQDNIPISKKSQTPLAVKTLPCPGDHLASIFQVQNANLSVSHEKGIDQWVVTPF